MTDGLLKKLQAAFQPGSVRQSLRHVGDLHLHDRPERRRQARLRRPRRHQPDDPRGAARRPHRPTRSRSPSARKARSSRCWPATKRSRAIGAGPTPTPRRCATAGTSPATPAIVDADGDLFVTGRVDDMIITGGENVSPVEIESCLSLHPAVSEVAVVGPADERWGKIVAAFVKRAQRSTPSTSSTHFCRELGSCQLQAAAPLRVRRRHPEIAGRQAAAPQARRGRIRAGTQRRLTDPSDNGTADMSSP